MGKLRDYLKTARATIALNRLQRMQTREATPLFQELRRKRMGALVARNSKAIGATVGGALGYLITLVLPDLAGSPDLDAFVAAVGAIIGSAVVTWFAPKNAE